jgi:hypothetical protein
VTILSEEIAETAQRHREAFRRAWGDEPSDAVPVAAPSVPGRDASSDEMPTGARRIAELARANGWRVREVYSRGPVRAGRPAVKAGDELSDEPSDDVDGAEVVTVRCLAGACASDARWAVACYRRPGAKWALTWCLLADRSDGLRRVKATELKSYLRGEEPSDEAPRRSALR